MKTICWSALLVLACSDPSLDNGGDGGRPRPTDLGVLDPGFGGAGGGGNDPGDTPNCSANSELCDALDNDCDGRVDEIACPCTGPTACFAGPEGARGLGVCTDGMRRCDATGESFGPCEGSVGPSVESCNVLDDDCDGTVDEFCDQPGAGGAGGVGGVGGAGGTGGEGQGGAGGVGGAGQPGQPHEERFVVGEDRMGRPVDFIMAVDNSGSMDDTVAQVEGNLGLFATRLVQANINYRLVLVSERGTDGGEPDICIPPPMAGPNCGDTENFLHLDEEVDSEEPFEDIVKCWNGCGRGISGFLRPGSLLQIVVVTDDESDMSWRRFGAALSDFGRPDFVVHGVVGLQEEECIAAIGEQYISAAQDTGGELLHICRNDWGQVIEVLLDATAVQLQRNFPLAGNPDPATIRVFVVQPNGQEQEQIGNWMYDAAANAVVFADGAGPPAGAQVIVRYTNR